MPRSRRETWFVTHCLWRRRGDTFCSAIPFVVKSRFTVSMVSPDSTLSRWELVSSER